MNEAKAIAPQHPAVVLRSHYQHLRAILAVTVVAVVGLTVAVVVLATTSSGGRTQARVSSGSAIATSTWHPGNVRYDGGPEEGSLFTPSPSRLQNPAYNYNGGHDEGNALSGTAITGAAPVIGRTGHGSAVAGHSAMTCGMDYSRNSVGGQFCDRRTRP